MEYMIVHDHRIEVVVEQVNSHLSKGWKLVGGIVATHINNKAYFLQALQK